MNEKVSGHPESQRSEHPLRRVFLLIGLAAAVMLGSMIFVFYLCNHMVARHAPLVDAAMEIKFEATAGHLAFEEMISGDRAENIEDILKHIDQALWYGRAMLEGGQSPEGRILALKDARLRQATAEVRDKLTEFRKITEQRWRQRDKADIRGEIGRRYNAVYESLIIQADLVETQLQRLIKNELTVFRAVQTILIAVCLLVTGAAALVFGRFVRRRIRDEIALRTANQKLAASEQELRREKDKVRRYLDVAAVMIVAIDFEQRVDLINKKGCAILGYDESEILGRNWFDRFLPERLRDQARVTFESVMAGEAEPPEYHEGPILLEDGKERLISWHDTVLRNDEGRILCMLCSGEDITERKQAEEELRQYEHIVSTSSDMLAFLDKSFTYIAANEAYLKAFKLTREQLIGRVVSEVFGEEFFAEVIKPNAERCLAGREVNYQTWVDFPAYEPRYMDITYYPYRSAEGEIDGFVVNGRNITERERAEEQLRQKDYVIESSSIAIATSNLDGEIIYGNPAFLDMWGFDDPDEFMGKHFTEFWTVAEQVDKIMDTLQTEGKWADEIKALRKDGSVFHVQVLASIVHDREGNPVSVMSSSVDITERKQAEEALRESEERFRSLSESSPVGIFHTDEQGAVLYTNPQWQLMTGLTLEDSLGFGWAGALHPDDKDRILELWDECLREEKGYSGEFRFLAPSGQVKWVYTSTSPIRSADGNVVGHVGMNLDITEQKQAELAIRRSEQKYRSLVANIPDVVWTTDQTGRTTFIGSNVKRVCGYSPEEIYREGERLWFGRMHPDDVDTVKQSYKALFEKGVQLDIEYRIRRKDGEWIWLRDRSIGAYEKDGVRYADGVFLDITELKQGQAERVRLTDILETTSDLVSTATPDRELTYLNRAGRRMLGWPADESCAGREIPDIHPDWAFDVIKNEGIPTAIEQGVWQGETALLRSDGMEIPVSQVIMAHKSPTGQVEYLSTIMRDITERKQAEQAIREKQRQLDSLLSNVDAIIMEGDQFDIYYVGGQVEKILGYPKELWYAEPGGPVAYWVKHLHPDDKGKVDTCREAIAAGKDHSFEYRMIAADGREVWFYDSITLEPQADGPAKSRSVMVDITDHKRAENELRQAKEFTDNAINAQVDTFFVFDPKAGRAIRWNKNFSRISGYTDEEIREMKAPDSYYDQDDLKKAEESLKNLEATGAATVELSLITKGGDRIPFEYRVSLFEVAGGETIAISTGRDITERKRAEEELTRYREHLEELVAERTQELRRSEERLGLAVEGAELGMWDWNVQTGDCLFSDLWSAMLEYEPGEIEPRVESWEHLLHPDDRPRVMDTLRRNLDAESAFYECEQRLRTRSGKWKWILALGKVVETDQDGRPLRHAGIQLDIDERKRAEEELINYRDHLERLVAQRTKELSEANESLKRDIAERKRAEEALHLSEEKFSKAFHSSPDSISITSVATGRLLEINEGFQKMFGYSRDEALGRTTLELGLWQRSEDRDLLLKEFEDKGRVKGMEIYVRDKSGGIHCCLISSEVIDIEGEPCFVAIARDITERKRAEEALHLSQEKFSKAFHSSPDAITISSLATGELLEVNEGFEEMSGYSRDEAIGKTTVELGFWPSSEDREVVLKEHEDQHRVKGVEIRSRHRSGEIHFCLLSSEVIDIKGEPCLVTTVRDITDRKRAEDERALSEQRLTLAQDAAGMGMYDWDIARDRAVCNERYFRLFGLEPQERMLSQEDWLAMVHPDDRQRAEMAVRDALEGKVSFDAEYRVIWPDGSVKWLSSQAKVFYDDEQKPHRMIGVLTDITERKDREKKLAEYKDQLRALVSELTVAEDRERRNIASLLHDDVLQKLAFSKMKLGMLRETLTGGEQLETLDNIQEHVSAMFKDMRSLTFDLCPPVLYDIGLEAALREWLQREAADKHHLAVSLERHGEPFQLNEELRVALYRATRELLVNVIKHAQAHSVGVTLVNLDGTVRIEVRDDGIGFEWSRADTTKEPSAGLGLFTVRERLEYLGGSLEIESEPGKGSRVMLTAALTGRGASVKERAEE